MSTKRARKQHKKAAAFGPFSGRYGPLHIDRRRSQGRFFAATCLALIEHVEAGGDEVTAPQAMIIESAALAYTKAAMLGAKMLADPDFGSGSTEAWLALMTSVRMSLKELGIKRQRVETVLPSPLEILEGKTDG